MKIQIKETLDVVFRCILTAEKKAKECIRLNLPDADEEQITTIFQVELNEVLRKASIRGEIESAFASDIENANLSFKIENAKQIACGLIAEVSWHPRHIEKKTGGDFGLVFARPQIEENFGEVTIKEGVATGLLVQAKRQRCGKKAGKFKKNQLKVLENRLDCTSIVLYKFEDIENRKLGPFLWHDCRNSTIDKVTNWLKEENFERNRIATTVEMLRKLESGLIGTSDPQIIKDVISPAKTRTMRIEVKWKDGPPPAVETSVLVKPKEEVFVDLYR